MRDQPEWLSRHAHEVEKFCMFFDSAEIAQAALPRFRALPGVEAVQGSPDNVEVTAQGVDKGTTLLAVATAVGVDPIHFGIIVVMNLVLGLCTPPVGVCLFAATNIGARYGKCTLSDSVKALVPLLIVNFGVLFLVTYVPFLTVGVANLVMG